MLDNGSAGHLNLKNTKYRNNRIFLTHHLVIKLTLIQKKIIILIIWIKMMVPTVCNHDFWVLD